MSQFEFVTKNEDETRRLGAAIGEHLQPSTLVFLEGTLGAGKSRLVQGIASGLGIDMANVQSPTFTLMTPHKGRLTLVHVDAYRINDLDEAEQLGLGDWLDAKAVLAIEWAERIAAVLPPPDLGIEIEHVDEGSRRFSLTAVSESGSALLKSVSSTFA